MLSCISLVVCDVFSLLALFLTYFSIRNMKIFSLKNPFFTESGGEPQEELSLEPHESLLQDAQEGTGFFFFLTFLIVH